MIKKVLVLLLFPIFILSLAAQPKIAVLDASLGEGVSPNASAIVADTINEQFVKSKDFTAIDRAYVSSVQEEKKFQLSGDVNEEDITEIGNTFGADYLCMANVSLLGSTYTVSARLIEVSTAEVISQESHRLQGEIDILFSIAEVVGAELVGINLATAEPIPISELEEEPEPQEEPEEKPEREKSDHSLGDTKSHFMISWMFQGYLGDDGNDIFEGEDYYSLYEQDLYISDNFFVNDVYNQNIGLDVHVLSPVFPFIYVSGGMTYTRQTIQAEDDFDYYGWANFTTLEPYLGIGGIIAPTEFLQIYGGGTLGAMVLFLGENYYDGATDPFWGTEAGETAVGLSLGFEIGANLFLKQFGFDIRYKLSKSPSLSADNIYRFSDEYDQDFNGDRSFGHHGLTLGLGFMF